MDANPYAPPKSEVDDVGTGAPAPALWNPNAAAAWSLVFSPAFGAFLHMKNWKALGDPARAAAAKTWVMISLGLLIGIAVLTAFVPENKALDGLARLGGLVMLLSWYYTQGKPQVAVVAGRFGKQYPKKGWTQPLLLAVAALVAYAAAAVAIAVIVGMLTTGA